MFIKSSQGGYNRHGEQFARGRFLVLFSHNHFKAEEQANPLIEGPYLPPWIQADRTKVCACAGNPYYYQTTCPVHKAQYVIPDIDSRKLYAVVRHCSLRQLGHWMMGAVNIAGQRLTVSGTYGNDGLPLDYESLTEAARAKLVDVPQHVVDAFWAGGGHNCAGSEAPIIRQWAEE